jgi:Uma2 family endonuclease
MPPAPLEFPAEEEVPETIPHLEVRTALYQSCKSAFATTSTIGSEQFVYYDPTSAAKRFAPDVFVKLGIPNRPFDIWKVWERGAPELVVEIVSRSDRPDEDWNDKLARYRVAGVREVVRFDGEDAAQPIRVWDLLAGELVERAPDDPDRPKCHALGLWWVVVEVPDIGRAIRLARDRAGADLLPTPDEAEARARAEQERAREAEARARAEQEREREAEARARAEQERDALLKELDAMRANAAKNG